MNKLSSAIAMSLALQAGTGFAQSPDEDTLDEEAKELGTVTVIGERREPGNMRVDGADLVRRQASSLEDIFANESSVAVGGGSVTAQKIYIRGFEDVMLNVTVDGAQSPGELYHHQARVQLEPEFIKTIELDAGAGPATNGAGALTGALRTTLKTADDMLHDDASFGAYLKAGYIWNGDDGDREVASFYGKLGETTGLVVGVAREDRGEYADGHGDLQEATPYNHLRGFAKLNGGWGDHDYSLTVEGIEDEATTYERPNLTDFANRYQLSDQELNRQTYVLNYGYRPGTPAWDLAATVYRNDNDFRIQRLNSDIIYGEGDFDSTGFDIRNTSLLGQHALTYGVDYRSDDLDSGQNATPPFAWGRTRQEASVAGIYIQDTWSITPVFDITAGVRYDDYSLKGKQGVSEGVHISDDGISPNIGLSWEVVDGLTLATTWARAFRGVTIREAFFSGLYIHDGNLESEEADNLEFSIAWENGPFYAAATVYEQNIENFIDIEYVGGEAWGYWRNIGDAKVEGYEVELGWETDQFDASVGVWDADNTLNDAPLVDANMGLGTTIGTTWLANFSHFGFDRVKFGAQARYVQSEPNAIADNAPDKQSYFVLNGYIDWNPWRDLTLALTVNNLFDEFYYDHATYTWLGSADDYVGYPARGREVIASASYRF